MPILCWTCAMNCWVPDRIVQSHKVLKLTSEPDKYSSKHPNKCLMMNFNNSWEWKKYGSQVEIYTGAVFR